MSVSFAIGAARVDTIVDVNCFELSLQRLFPAADPEQVATYAAALAPDHLDVARGVVRLGIHSLLVRTGRHTILIDTCVGAHKPRPLRPDWHQRGSHAFLDRLAGLGVAPADIDIVLCTHLHADHVGWNTRLSDGRWVPTFPRARYLIGRREFAHWENVRQASDPAQVNHGAFDDSVLPLVEHGLSELVDDGHQIETGLVLAPLAGHTPGQMGLRLVSDDARALFCGDAVHSPLQVFHPAWSSAFCHDPDQAHRTRLDLLDEAADAGSLLVPAHFRGAARARVVRRNGGFAPRFGG